MRLTKFALVSSLVVSEILASSIFSPSFAATALVGSGGLTITSLAFGLAGAIGSEQWYMRALSYGVGVVDPASATFYEGKIVLKYPENLLTVTGVGWFGNFSNDPNLPVPPVISTPFFELGSTTPISNFLIPANPDINATQNINNGVVTVTFNAPNGVNVTSDPEFNLLAVVFQNTSGQDLLWNHVTNTSDSANFFSDSTQQSLICKPDPLSSPTNCGSDTPSNEYEVSKVPEPITILGTGLAVGLGILFKHQQKFSKFTKK